MYYIKCVSVYIRACMYRHTFKFAPLILTKGLMYCILRCYNPMWERPDMG